jgi:glycosyltransferase involved in cell wall biosynthesis
MAHVLVIGSYPDSLLLFRGDLLKTLAAGGHRVTATAGVAPESVVRALLEIGVGYEPLSLERTGRNPIADLGYAWNLFRAIRRIRPDLVLSYTAKPVIYGSLAARLAGTRRIYSMVTGLGYAFDETQASGKYTRRLMRRLYALALGFNERVLVQNPDDLDELVRAGCIASSARGTIVNGSGVDLAHFLPQSVSDMHPSFLMIARLLGSKGVNEYVEAARIVRRSCPTAHFALVGWFDDHPTAIGKAQVQSWQAEGLINYVGPVDDVRPHLAQCSVYVLPSYREGTPRTVLEAMATARAVITTDVPGCRETVSDGVNGILVPPRDAESLAAAMLRLARDAPLARQMGIAGRRIAEEKYDVRLVTRATLDAMSLAC